jgi:FAS-associated factor 2
MYENMKLGVVRTFFVFCSSLFPYARETAAQKLQATTFPFVAFVALQPPRSSAFMGTSSRPSPSPSLTILSRHQGPAIPASAPTSARSITNHIILQLLPRVTPFLESLRLTAAERSRDRALREEQDAAFRESARRDREKEARRIEEARRAAELEKAAMERQRAADEACARIHDARDRWRRESRQALLPLESSNADPIRMTIRLPDGQRLVRLVARNSTVTSLYCLVDAHFAPSNVAETEIGASTAENSLRELILSSRQPVEAWWGFSLFTAYPRQAIPWRSSVHLTDVGLENGGQIVVEMVCKEEDKDEDGYDTEKSE